MVKHIVLMKMKEESKAKTEEFRELLVSMKENIALIKTLEVGVNIKPSPRSFDISIEACFDSEQDLQSYLDHPYHTGPILEFLREVTNGVSVIDYNI
ncbi:Dabb family protein [Candidatus Epulonipiscium viviparus]|uniref:Dabb family protein n=1 Tax=Candidatus Epulonipiscium viviparus TaxID=420336 RepID=UPI0004956682|nr:Dabb family protein [Candidatus Epulopiscium viviparus]